MATNAEDANGNVVFIYTGEGDGAVVPDDVTHVRVDPSVTVIADGAFQGRLHLEKVELCEGLLIIESKAFFECKSLIEVNIPCTLRVIGESAFSHCETLELLDGRLPEGLEEIRNNAFRGCTSLIRINSPSTVLVMGAGAFYGCAELAEVDLSEGLLAIADSSFQGCTSLTRINVPSTLEIISRESFANSGLTSLDLPDTVEAIGMKAICDCGIRNFRIPNLVAEVDKGTLHGCNRMFSILLPKSLKRIEENAFLAPNIRYLRNIAIPPNCNVGNAFGRESNVAGKDIEIAFPSADGSVITEALKHRFDNLPLHHLCYYESAAGEAEYLKRLDGNGSEKDCLGMTPLHILTCATKHDLKVYQLMIDKFPKSVVTKDKWGTVPLFYALWGDVPQEVLQLLVDTQRKSFDDHILDWGSMVKTLCRANAPEACIQKLLVTQQTAFPDHVDWKEVLCEWADSDDNNLVGPPAISIQTFKFVMKHDINTRLNALAVIRWREKVESNMDSLCWFVQDRRRSTERLYTKLAFYEQLKETTSLLELTLWKVRIAETATDTRHPNGESRDKKAKIDDFFRKEQCRINCGAEIVLPNVLSFLMQSLDGDPEEEVSSADKCSLLSPEDSEVIRDPL